MRQTAMPATGFNPMIRCVSAFRRRDLLVTVLLLFALVRFGQAQVVTPVEGPSWLEHLHRSFNSTSMGQSSGVHGPAAPAPNEWPLRRPPIQLSNKFTGQSTTLYGADLYRLKCQGCHGASR